MSRKVTIRIGGNLLMLDPTTPRIQGIVAPLLTYTTKIILRGRERYLAEKEHRSPVYDREYECFNDDHRGRLVTQYGFLDRIVAALEAAGYAIRYDEVSPHPDPSVYEPQWERFYAANPGLKFRYKQKALLKMLAAHRNGRIDCPTGYGKSFCIGLAAQLFPRAKIDVLTRTLAVLETRLYPELCSMLPSVGIVSGKRKVLGRRVTCYSFGSLHHAEGDADFVFIDESHQAAADDVAAKWGRYDKARIFGFSASHDMRLDGKDVRVEGLCGPVRLTIPYQKAVEKGIVVPIEVHWTDVIMDVDPCGDAVDAEKKRLGIWANEHRNRLIRRDARRYGDDVQVLIAVATFEHALHLKRLLPEFKLMYNADSIKPSDWVYYKKQHLIPPDFALLTDHRRTAITKRFEAGRIRWVIATPVWNVGVDMRWLQVLVRGDGGGSPINDVQLPGRTSRTNSDGKAVGIVHDYRDFFNTGCARNSASREKTYERMGWTQHYPDRANRGALRRLMRWGDAE